MLAMEQKQNAFYFIAAQAGKIVTLLLGRGDDALPRLLAQTRLAFQCT